MQEDQQNTEWHDVSDGEHIGCKERPLDGAVIRKLVLDHLTVHQPSHDDTRQEGTCWQHQLCCQEVTEVHQRHAKHLQVGIGPYRKGAEHGNQRTYHREDPSGPVTRQMEFLMEEGRTDLVHGDGRCQGSEDQQGIEQAGDDIAVPRE